MVAQRIPAVCQLLARRLRHADRREGVAAGATKKPGGQGVKSTQLDN